MTLFHDLRYALRTLHQQPAFTVVALLIMALGIGANTAIFSVFDAVLLRPLPFEENRRLVALVGSEVSIPDGVDLRAESRTLEETALFLRTWNFDITQDGEPQRLRGAVVEPQLFEVLRIEPTLGRVLTADDNQVGGPPVVVVSEGFWRRRLGGARNAVGRQVRLNDQPTTVVGVMPPELDFLGDGLDLWSPVAVTTPWALSQRGTNNFDAIGRLRDGVTLAEARAEVHAITSRLAAAYPRTNESKVLEPQLLLDRVVGNVRQALTVLFGAVGLVLLISSLNLAGLLLARSMTRQREVATRMSLGAPRRRLVQQMIGEALVLTLSGGVLGLLVAAWGKDFLLALAPEALPRAAGVDLNLRVAAFALVVSVSAGLVTGLLPALRMMGTDAGGLLHADRWSSTGRGSRRALGFLVALEVALAAVLLVGCGLLLKSFHKLGGVALGFDPENVLTAEVSLPPGSYSEIERQTVAFQDVIEAVSKVSGVEAAALVIGAPLATTGLLGNKVVFQGRPPVELGKEPGARHRLVSADYFRVVGQPILEGRAFTPEDGADAPLVAIVNERFAREHWRGSSPVGDRIAWRSRDEPRWMEIVGVAADIKGTMSIADEDARAIYTPYPQRDASWQDWGTLLVRTTADPVSRLGAVKEAVWSVEDAIPLADVGTLEQRFSGALAQDRFNTVLLGFFAAVALILAVLGIQGVLAFAVEQRRREIGVRMALGAGRGRLLRGVIGRGLALVSTGLAGGLAAALGLGRLFSGLLFGVESTDAGTFLAVAFVVVASAVLGCYLPANRASRIDPIGVLRHE